MPDYYVNKDDSYNPNNNHEVHKDGCLWMPANRTYLGNFVNAVPAVAKAKQYYSDADGCARCCPEAHRG